VSKSIKYGSDPSRRRVESFHPQIASLGFVGAVSILARREKPPATSLFEKFGI